MFVLITLNEAVDNFWNIMALASIDVGQNSVPVTITVEVHRVLWVFGLHRKIRMGNFLKISFLQGLAISTSHTTSSCNYHGLQILNPVG